MRSAIGILALLGFVGLGCRDNPVSPPPEPHDMAGNPIVHPMDMATPPPPGSDLAGLNLSPDLATAIQKTYVVTTIANMRQGKSGSYEFDDVVSISPSVGGATQTIYVQDSAGGDFSASKVECESASMVHPCPMAAYMTMKTPLAEGHSVTIQGTYIKSSASGVVTSENFYVDTITDNGNANMPAATVLQLADIERSAMKTANWYQRVTVTLSDTLKVYDLGPLEFAYNNAAGCAKCPCQFGFGMIPSAAGAAAAPACNGMMTPAAQAINPEEVFISTDFYVGFTISPDCLCSAMYKDTQVTPAMSVAKGATITGLLGFDSVYMTTDYYQYFAPVQNSDFPLK